jgi:RTX calcium-binding nonapeptide repeat (4 copies)
MATRKWKNEFTANTTTIGDQDNSSVTALADGGFVIAWQDNLQTGDVIRFQRYDASGVKLGGEVLVNYTIDEESNPAIVQLADGNLCISQQRLYNGTDNDTVIVVFDLNGNFVRYQNGGSTSGSEITPAVASLGINGGVMVWTNETANGGDVRVQGFDASGATTFTTAAHSDLATLGGLQFQPFVAATKEGSKFVVTWNDYGLPLGEIRARVFDSATGAALSTDFTINASVNNTENSPSVTWLDSSRFVTTWYQFGGGTEGDGQGLSIKVIIRNIDGSAASAEQVVNTTIQGDQFNPEVTALPNGGFVIAWTDNSGTGADAGSLAIRLQAFDTSGNKTGGEILVNTTTFGDQYDVHLAALADGRVVVSWTDGLPGAYDIHAQIIDPRDGIIDGTGLADKLYGHDSVGDIISAGDGADFVYGLNGSDSIYGGDGVDTLDGGRGDDVIYGGLGSDSIIGGAGGDDIVGEAGTDLVSFRKSTAGVNVNFATGEGIGGEADGDTYETVESFGGSNFADVFIGANVATSRIDGYNGDDNLTGGSGADVFFGGAGADTINGLGGIDRAFYSASTAINVNLLTNINTGGEAQDDSLTNIEEISGSAFADSIIGNTLVNRLFGQAGGDHLDGGTGADVLTGGTGSDSFAFNFGQSGTTATTLDYVTDYTKGIVGTGDEIDANVALSIGGSTTVATAVQASVNATTGVATFFVGSGVTLADALNDIALSMTTGTDAAGEFAFFRINNTGDSYMFISDGIAGVGANDVLVRMTALTSINTISIDAGDVTILT